MRTTVAKMSGSEPEPSPPTVNGIFSASAQVFTADSCQVTQVETSLVPLPSQVNFCASNDVWLVPISGSIAMPRENMPITLPSLGAAL